MNFSPLNDPEFQKYREEAHVKAAKERRNKMLVVLVTVTLLSLVFAALLSMAAAEAFPAFSGLFGKGSDRTLPPLPPPGPSGAQSSGAVSDPDNSSSEVSPVPPSASPSDENSKPSENVRATTIYVDAGHGFLNPGGTVLDLGAGENSFYSDISESMGKRLYEADLTLAISQKVRDLLKAKGYEVIMSREGYVSQALSPTQRSQRASATGADALVSVHANFFSNTSVYGARVYYSDSRSDASVCKNYANAIAKAIDAGGASRKNTGVYVDNSLAMVKTQMPAVLVETCFITNEQDARDALTEEWQSKMAAAIVSGIEKQFPLRYTVE